MCVCVCVCISIRDMEYADDMALVCDSMNALEQVLRALDGLCGGMGLSISARKMKILAVHPVNCCSAPPRAVMLGEEQEPVEVVLEFEHLGSTISQDFSLDVEVNMGGLARPHTFSAVSTVYYMV